MTRRNVIDFDNTADEGALLRWRCTCGHEGTLGRRGSVADSNGPAHQVLAVAVPDA